MPDRAQIVRIPLTIVATGSGQKTDGVIVAVLNSDLDALEAENERLRAICLAHDTDPEGCVECFQATIEGREPAALPHGITPQPEHGDVLRRALDQ